jgi:DNA repair exonuclease SbcCD ATPase subunit
MKVSFVSIKNILGLKQFELTPGHVTMITGANGTGKTSLLDALRSLFERTGAKVLKHVDATKGEILLELVDGDTRHSVKRSITAKGDYVTVDGDNGRKGWLQSLSEATRLNPVAFLNASNKERVEKLLSAVSVAFPRERLLEVVKPLLDSVPDRDTLNAKIKSAVSKASNPLEQIDAVLEAVKEWRTGVARSMRDAVASADNLRQALPADGAAVSVDDDLASVEKALDISTREEFDRLSMAKAEAAAAYKKIDDELAAKQSKIKDEYRTKVADLREQKARLESLREEVARSTQTRKLYEQASERQTALENETEACITAIKAIGDIKAGLLAALPVPGLEVIDGEVFKDGIPFDRLNTQQKIDIAVSIAESIESELDVCLIDGFECFDPEHAAAFIERAKRSNLQFIIASVSADGLQAKVAA